MDEYFKNHAATPLMRQYIEIKKDYEDALVLFQVGDFYELFFDDAKKAASFLGITLTARGKNNGDPIPLCGVPVHALDYYLIKLVRGGFRVVICNQLQEPQPGKVVERGVTQVLTPGTLTDAKLLDEKSPCYLFSFFPTKQAWGFVFVELMTGQLFITTVPAQQYTVLEAELARFAPNEILIPADEEGKHFFSYFTKRGYCTSLVAGTNEQNKMVQAWMQQQFGNEQCAMLAKYDELIAAITSFYTYFKKNQEASLIQFKTIHLYKFEDCLMLDGVTQKNLELVVNNHDGGRINTLFALLDGALTAMGSRMIKKWILRPLTEQYMIEKRQEVVSFFVANSVLLQKLRFVLEQVGDLERIVGRIALSRASIHDYLLLAKALSLVPQVQQILVNNQHISLLADMQQMIGFFDPVKNLLTAALNDDAAIDWTINKGFDQELDHIRNTLDQSSRLVLDLEAQEQKRTGISSLKVRYNQVHGYYIEITKANLDLVPSDYIRHQTLVGKERFTIRQLEQIESDILQARNKVEHLEEAILLRVKHEVSLHVTQLRKLAHAIACIDGLQGLAFIAHQKGYTRPTFNDNNVLDIKQARHPVVEASLDRFVANDVYLDKNQRILLITGPNMGGKSTYLRQLALLCIMAQLGSFVPAQTANLFIVDRIFTRIGAADNVARGKSTFLVEMEETALICREATSRSLVILDEVGRGTSTFDGLAVAWAVIEYIHETLRALCLFATHYHELTTLHTQRPEIVNYRALSKQTGQGILLLYKIVPGIADGSFGIEVARKAHLPLPIVNRAQEILVSLANDSVDNNLREQNQSTYDKLYAENIALKKALDETMRHKIIVEQLRTLDYDALSPKQAFDTLWKMKESIRGHVQSEE